MLGGGGRRLRQALELAVCLLLGLGREPGRFEPIPQSRHLGLADDDPRINPMGGAIALGHPLGMTGARLIATAMLQLHRTRAHRALCTMCVGVGQGIALVIERV